MSIKALLFGFFYTVILGLIIQLAFIFLAMGYTELLKDYPAVETLALVISYFVGIAVYFALMASAGFLTAAIARTNVISHSIAISFSAIGLSLLSSINEDEFTWVSLAYLISGIIFSIIGALRWKKAQ